MAPGKRKRSRRRPEVRPTGRGPRKGERKTEQSHVGTVSATEEVQLPSGQVVTYPFHSKGHNDGSSKRDHVGSGFCS